MGITGRGIGGVWLDIKLQIIETIMKYERNEYTTTDFCNAFVELYYFAPSGCRFFQGGERAALDKLAFFADRYTTYEEDIKRFPMHYKTEDEIRRVFDEVKRPFIAMAGTFLTAPGGPPPLKGNVMNLA